MSSLMSEQAAEKIKRMIASGEYPPGSQLPNEQALIERLNVSRGTVREAIKILQSQNILEIRRGIGTFVTEFPGMNDDPFGLGFITSDTKVHDLWELRMLLEPGVARLASQRATEEDVAALRRCCNKLIQLSEKYDNNATGEQTDKFANADAEFHCTIYRCTHNEVLERMIPFVKITITESYMRRDYRLYHSRFHTKDGHTLITDAIEQGDGDKAAEYATKHVELGMKILDYAHKKFTTVL